MNLTKLKGKMVVGLLVLTGGGIFHSQAQSNNASTQPQVQEVNMAGKTDVPEDTVAKGQGKKLDEVVVTALGIKSNAKSLGYAASTISAEEVSKAASSSAMSGLTGKVAGVNISSAGGAGTSQKVIIRGISSFSGNQPLYVVDGVPMLNSFMGNNTFANSVDFGNGANDINPDDVESVTVLKGASATALYGSRASSGVVMITTKRGQQNQKLSVTYNGSFMAVDVLKVPLNQDRFGQGWPYFDANENGSWGPRLDGVVRPWGVGAYTNELSWTPPAGFVPREKPFSYVKNNIRNFYETGFETNNNISVSGGNSLASFVMSYGNAYTNGVIPTNVDKYVRNTFSLRGDMKYKKFSASIDANYIAKNIKAIAAGQGNNGSTTFQELLQIPVDIPITALKDYNSRYNNTDNYFTAYAVNPYWAIHNSGNNYKDDRIFGKIELSYEIIKGLKAVGRLSGDYTNADIQYYNNLITLTPGSWAELGGQTPQPGYFQQTYRRLAQTEVIGFLNADYELWKNNISLNAIAGYNFNQNSDNTYTNYVSSLLVPNFYQITNSANPPVPLITQLQRRLMAALGQVNLGFRDYWFLNFSLRNDWSSTLPINANSYFYWGVNTSLVITDMLHREFGIDMKGVDFLKFRVAYGTTGKDASPYYTNAYYPSTNINLGYGSIIAPVNGVPMFTLGNTAANTKLQPEFTSEYELGLEGKFLQSRLGFDIAWYDKTTKGQIIASSVAPETGFTTYARNIGKINNRGIELAIYGSPVKTKDFEWQLGLTFTKNWSKVVALWDNNGVPVTRYVITSAYTIDYVAEVGKPLGLYQGPKPLTNDKGQVIVGSATGRPLIDPVNKQTLGSSNPDFVMGLTTRFMYKGFALSATFDYRQGGYFYSYSSDLMIFDGNAPLTVYNNRNPFVIPNSVTSNTGSNTAGSVYTENYRPITTSGMYSYYNHSTNSLMDNESVLSKTYVKLRELVLSYTLPAKLFGKSGIKGMTVSLIGRNLFVATPQSNTYVDPDATNYGNDIISEFGEFAAAPSTRSYGASVKITF